MHNYSLHTRVRVRCECCQLASDFHFTSHSDQVICSGCVRHQGDGDRQRDLRNADHASVYLSEIGVLQEDLDTNRERQRNEYQRDLERLEAQVAAKDAQLAEQDELITQLQTALRTGTIDGDVSHWLADEEVQEAYAERDRARRSRDLVFRALSRLGVLHRRHPSRPHYCVCNAHVDQCRVFQAIESELDVLAKWEQHQLERHHDGLDHNLPSEFLSSIKATERRNA
jgi:hypothetical protein